MQGHLGPRDLCLNKLGIGPLGMQCYILNFKLHTKFQASEQSGSKKSFEYFSMYFQTRRGHLGP